MGSLKSMLSIFLAISTLGLIGNAQLNPHAYCCTCPNVTSIIRGAIERARQNNININAQLIRLHFHDCFVNGCDGSVLLDASPADGVEGEKNAFVNRGSLKGFEVVDDIKTAVENVCPNVVSCADILAIASEISVELAGGPSWEVPLGRRDSRRASEKDANDSLPRHSDPIDVLISKFAAQGLDPTDLVALSGAHTFGRVRCLLVNNRLYNFSGSGQADQRIAPAFLQTLTQQCPTGNNGSTPINLDPTSPDTFDNNYFTNLRNNLGVMSSDQVLFSTNETATVAAVGCFACNQNEFFNRFVKAMIKMGNIKPLTGRHGEIRKNCKRVNKCT